MTDACLEPPPRLLLEAIEQFNRAEFFEQHESLEELWLSEKRAIRLFYQGILQVGVACHHLLGGRKDPAVRLLRLGLEKLAPFPPICQQVDLQGFRQRAERLLRQLEVDDENSSWVSSFPKVMLVTEQPR